MTRCTATNGTYRCHRTIAHPGDHASIDASEYALRWGGARGTYSQRIAPILERAFAGEKN